jgi:hypothetical protein
MNPSTKHIALRVNMKLIILSVSEEKKKKSNAGMWYENANRGTDCRLCHNLDYLRSSSF